MTAPVIQSIGPPPERHAQRMAGEMTRWLIEQQFKIDAAWREAVVGRNDGNPNGQKKMVAKLKAIGGMNLFWIQLFPGKRRKYELRLYRWVGWHHRRVLEPGDPMPEKPWIAVLLQRIISTYASGKVEEYAIALIGQHAIARLAERCGARTPFDILLHVKKLSRAVLHATAHEVDEDGKEITAPLIDITSKMPPGGWRIPYDEGVAVLVMDDDSGLPVIATILPKAEVSDLVEPPAG
jgi:hypothetical protein